MRVDRETAPEELDLHAHLCRCEGLAAPAGAAICSAAALPQALRCLSAPVSSSDASSRLTACSPQVARRVCGFAFGLVMSIGCNLTFQHLHRFFASRWGAPCAAGGSGASEGAPRPRGRLGGRGGDAAPIRADGRHAAAGGRLPHVGRRSHRFSARARPRHSQVRPRLCYCLLISENSRSSINCCFEKQTFHL